MPAICAFITIALCAIGTARQQSGLERKNDHASRIAAALQLTPCSTEEFSAALTKLFATGRENEALGEDELDNFARFASSHVAANIFFDVVYKEIHVDTAPFGEGPLGSPARRIDAIEQLRARAVGLADVDKSRARAAGRAMLLLSSLDPFYCPPPLLNSALADPNFVAAAELTDDQIQELKRVSKGWARAAMIYVEATNGPVIVLDDLIKRQAAPTRDEGERFFKPIIESWTAMAGDPRGCRSACNLIWLYRCHAQSVGATEALHDADARIERLAKSTSDPLYARWLMKHCGRTDQHRAVRASALSRIRIS